MNYLIGKYDPATRTVEVRFDHAGVQHRRNVNACRDAAGKYDAAATKARVIDVAAGVETKINLGVIASS